MLKFLKELHHKKSLDLLSVANKSSERLTLSISRPKHSCPADSLEKRAIPKGRFRKAKPTVSHKSFISCDKTLNLQYRLWRGVLFEILKLPENMLIFLASDTLLTTFKELTKFLVNSFYTYFHKLMKKYFFIFVNKVSTWYKKYTDPPQILFSLYQRDEHLWVFPKLL